MSLRIGQVGASTRELADRRSLARAGYGVMLVAALGVVFNFLPHTQAAGLAVVVALGIGLKGVMTLLESKIDTRLAREKRPAPGAVAGENLGELLDEHGDAHLILHKVRCQYGRIDHIVFSKNHGIFLVDAKSHTGRVAVVESRISVNGRLPVTDFVGDALRHSGWFVDEVRKITGIEPAVNPLVVFTDAFVVTSRTIKGVTILNKDFLLASIQRLGQPIAPEIWDARERIAASLTEE